MAKYLQEIIGHAWKPIPSTYIMQKGKFSSFQSYDY